MSNTTIDPIVYTLLVLSSLALFMAMSMAFAIFAHPLCAMFAGLCGCGPGRTATILALLPIHEESRRLDLIKIIFFTSLTSVPVFCAFGSFSLSSPEQHRVVIVSLCSLDLTSSMIYFFMPFISYRHNKNCEVVLGVVFGFVILMIRILAFGFVVSGTYHLQNDLGVATVLLAWLNLWFTVIDMRRRIDEPGNSQVTPVGPPQVV